MDKLKRCPFCGAIPTIEYEPDISPNSGIYRLSAKHDNTCFIRVMNGMNRYGEMSDRTKDIIVSAWNRRLRMNKCGNCRWLVTKDSEPYYCALKDLYTIKDKQDDACEEYLAGSKKR